jgi:hypothetical protein
MTDATSIFQRTDGTNFSVSVCYGQTFTDYETVGNNGSSAEIRFEDGVIVGHFNIPEEIKTPDEARSWAALFMAAADAMEKSTK